MKCRKKWFHPYEHIIWSIFVWYFCTNFMKLYTDFGKKISELCVIQTILFPFMLHQICLHYHIKSIIFKTALHWKIGIRAYYKVIVFSIVFIILRHRIHQTKKALVVTSSYCVSLSVFPTSFILSLKAQHTRNLISDVNC